MNDIEAGVTHADGWKPNPPNDPLPEPVTGWVYTDSDPALMLFTAALEKWQMPFRPGDRILEIGCAESDWLERMHRWDASFQLTGLDWRKDREPNGYTFVQGSAMDLTLFPTGSFDWIVMLGALEHFGLGWYGDPKDKYGDVLTMYNALVWLKAGGSVYFDVPCNPESSQTAHFRTYAPGDVTHRLLRSRLFTERARGYSLPEPNAGTWIPEPTEHLSPYHFVAVWAQTDA